MKISQLFAPTLKEAPSEAETDSHQLLLRAGLIRKLASGIYSYLPMGWRVLNKIMNVTREELDRIGSQELLMPALHPAEPWQATGRWEAMGDVMLKLKDRNRRDFCLGTTHEEIITTLVAKEVRSYKELPLLLYQIQTKFRDEPRPRGGVIRAREFIMMDLYSFHLDWEDLEKTYQEVYQAYLRIFERCALPVQVVEADPGQMGGNVSHEFMLVSPSGEDTLFRCTSEGCSYAANGEKAEYWQEPNAQGVKKPAADAGREGWTYSSSGGEPPAHSLPEKVHTPSQKTIEDLTRFLKKEPKDFIKTLLYESDGKIVAALVRGDREINEVKLKRVLGSQSLSLADEEAVRRSVNLPIGFVGPVNLKGIRIVADHEVQGMQDAICGANESDYHLTHVSYGREFTVEAFDDLRQAAPGDRCPRCASPMEICRGIELGHIFKLGTKYSEPLQATFLDLHNVAKPMIMGCYGIGISRMMAALIEQYHDKDGIIWPFSMAPYQVAILAVNTNDENQTKKAEEIYRKLAGEEWEVLLDDRNVRAGVKFKDCDLLGIPLRITVGGKAASGIVEVKLRKNGTVQEVTEERLSMTLRELARKDPPREPALKGHSSPPAGGLSAPPVGGLSA